MTRNDTASSTGASSGNEYVSRRAVLRAAGAGAATLGVGLGGVTGAGAQASDGIPTPWLDVNGNLVQDQVGNTVNLRGLNIADPRRMADEVSQYGKTAPQAVDYFTNADEGWHSRIVRIPCQPWDIAGLPGVWTARNELSASERPDEFVCPEIEGETDCTEGHYEPPLFTEEQLTTYLETYLDPVVERCRENGVYCIVDFHRHWGAQLHWADPDTGEPNAALSQEVERFWNAVAPRYAEDSHVIYEVYNEPTNPGMWEDPTQVSWAEEPWHWWLDTAQPWVDTIREHAPRNLVLIGNPGWTQSPEGALVEPFEGDNLAYVYHIYAQHEVSQNGTWDEAGPSGQGVKSVYEEYPLFVTEWGWGAGDNSAYDSLTTEFGQPFADWLESSDAIHWQAWGFYPDWGENTVEPAFDGECADAPCEWTVPAVEDAFGPFVQGLLETHRNDGLPEWSDDGGLPSVGDSENSPQDPDDDGLYEDVNGDGATNLADAGDLFQHRNADAVQNEVEAYDFSDNGSIDLADVVQLFQENTN